MAHRGGLVGKGCLACVSDVRFAVMLLVAPVVVVLVLVVAWVVVLLSLFQL